MAKQRRRRRLAKAPAYPKIYQPHNVASNHTLYYSEKTVDEVIAELKADDREDTQQMIAKWSARDWNQFKLAYRINNLVAGFREGVASWFPYLTDDELEMVDRWLYIKSNDLHDLVEGTGE